MASFIKRTLFFLLIVVFAFTVLNFFQSYYNSEPEHYKKQYESIINYKNDYNGIILGTSHATHSIRPSILDKSGIQFYNYALNGANPEFYFKWYNIFLSQTKKKPDFCLFTVDFFMFDKRWLWREIQQDAEYLPTKLFHEKILTANRVNKLYLIFNRFPFLKYRNRITNSLKLEQGHKCFNIDNYDRGYISYSKQFNPNDFKPELEYVIDTSQVKYFEMLLKQMQDDNITVFFVMTPEYGLSANEYSKMKSLKIIDSIADSLNIQVFNYNTQYRSNINQNISWFSDWDHLNHEGASVFSKKLAENILEQKHKIIY